MKIGTVEKVKGSWCVFTTEDRKKFYYAKRYHRLRGVIWAEFYTQKDARLHLKDMVEKGEVDLGEVYTYYGNLRETIKKIDYKGLYEKYFMETRKLKDEVIEWENVAKERQKMFNNLLASTEQMVKSCRELIENME
jgi:hypothetical protein